MDSLLRQSSSLRYVQGLVEFGRNILPGQSNRLVHLTFSVTVLLILQLVIVPRLTGQALNLDFVTPFIAILAIRSSYFRALFIAFLGALVIESYSSLPQGLYFCIYWVIIGTVYLFRNTISWMQSTPWVYTIMLASTWATLFEAFVAGLLNSNLEHSPLTVLSFLLRILFSTFIGMVLSKNAMREMVAEDRGL